MVSLRLWGEDGRVNTLEERAALEGGHAMFWVRAENRHVNQGESLRYSAT